MQSTGDQRPRVQRLRWLWALIFLTVGLPALAEEDGPQLDPNLRSGSHKVVLITDEGVNPKSVQLEPNQLVAWISYSRSSSTIIFDREVARNMICHSMVNFSLDKDELRSAPIDPGEFASFCQLRPGTYPYEIARAPQPGTEKKETERLPNLKGAIVVNKSE